jgi:glycosyltransferase involved in cell wall biosynthesis
MSGNSDKVRILFLNHWARFLGGAEYSLLDILPEVARRAEVFLVTSEPGTLCNRLQSSGITVMVIPCIPNVVEVKRDFLLKMMIQHWRAVAAFARFTVRVSRFVAAVRPDIIHANVPKSHITFFLLMLLGYHGRGVVHMREIFPQGGLARRLYGLLFPASRTGIIAISEAVRNALPGRMRAKAEVIYNGVAIGNCGCEMNRPPPVRFLYLGRIVPWKGCHLLLDAFNRLIKIAIPGSATLCMTGATIYWKAAYREMLKRYIVENRLEASVTLDDSTDDPYQVLYSHHVLCMASDCEPFGRVAVEAQSCGLPVIGFSSGGLPEIVVHGETGFLVHQGDIDGFTQVMMHFVAEPSMIVTMGSKGKERAQRLFNRDRQVPLITDYILSLIDRS